MKYQTHSKCPRLALVAWMKDSGITASALARDLGITRGYLSLIISHKKTPAGELAAQIERTTGGAVMTAWWWSHPVAAPDTVRKAG